MRRFIVVRMVCRSRGKCIYQGENVNSKGLERSFARKYMIGARSRRGTYFWQLAFHFFCWPVREVSDLTTLRGYWGGLGDEEESDFFVCYAVLVAGMGVKSVKGTVSYLGAW